jgi:hypothetical protein
VVCVLQVAPLITMPLPSDRSTSPSKPERRSLRATVKRPIISTLSASLLASMLFVTPLPALAQLTPVEVACRNQGQFFYDRAIERDRGWSITDSMLLDVVALVGRCAESLATRHWVRAKVCSHRRTAKR